MKERFYEMGSHTGLEELDRLLAAQELAGSPRMNTSL
jgi:hypothetical protein